ncbi:MAG: PKD domain-containing protein [Euryarchaeota archaeon]|nr:PKD domain-containing protein [Euryarchaeota archaeon]
MNKKLIAIVILITLVWSAVPVFATSSAPVVNLPTEYVTMSAIYGPNSWFEMTLSGVPEGYDIGNGQYFGWCVQKSLTMTKYVEHAVVLYSSYDLLMPVSYRNGAWDKINYVLNHKQGSRASIENVIWHYVGEATDLSSDVDAQAMIADADANGTGFVPQPGEVIAIIVEGVETIQRTFLELVVPEPQTNAPAPPSRKHGNHAPTADGTAREPYSGFAGEDLVFDGSRSYDRDGYIVSWSWDFGDGNTGSGAVVSHVYSAEGKFIVRLTVTDEKGSSNLYSTKAVITLANYPPSDPLVYGPTTGTKNTVYEYTAVSSDPDYDTIQYVFTWGDGNTTSTEFIPSGTVVVKPHFWAVAGVYTLSVKALDGETESGSTVITVLIDAVLVGDLGYLMDNDGDGIYDVFYSKSTGATTAVEQSGGEYLLDVDGDGSWDHVFNAAAGNVQGYRGDLLGLSPAAFILIIGVVLLLLIVTVFVAKKKWIRKRANGGN